MSSDYSYAEEIKAKFAELNKKYPYKKKGDAESYSQHREGISDAFDRAEQEMLKIALESKERETSNNISNKIEYWDEFIDDMENLTSERILDKYIIQRREG